MRIDMLGARSIPAKHGGLEVAAEQLSLELIERGHSVRAIIDRNEDIVGTEKVAIHGVGAVRTKHLHALTQTINSMPPVLARRPDIAHFHGVGPGMFATVPMLRGVPSVVTVQGLDWQREKWSKSAQKVFGLGVRASLKRPAALISVSRTLQRELLRQLGVISVYVPNGVRLPAPVTTEEVLSELGVRRGNYILFAARLVPEKGAHFLFEAYRKLGSPIPLVIAGSGGASYSDGYETSLRESAPPGVIFAGFRSGRDLQELFAHARAYVLPSVLEGLPLSLLEAMSHGLPVIHSNIPECEEVTRGDAGRSFEVRNPTDLARVLGEVLSDEALSAALGASALARVASDYTWPVIAKETERIYEEILKGGGKFPPRQSRAGGIATPQGQDSPW